MASVFLKRSTWYVRIKDHTGGWKSIATKAATKTEAKRLAQEMETKAERQRLGLEQRTSDNDMTLGQLCEWWLKERCPKASHYNESARLKHHVISADLGKLLLQHVTTAVIETRLHKMEKGGLGPHSINRLRGTLHTVYAKARKAGLWVGINPLDDVESRRAYKKVHPTLRDAEVAVLLPHVPDDWRDLFATAIYTGMRKGELIGLMKSAVDLENKSLMVSRSYGRETTKGGHIDAIPIADPLLPYLKHALESSKGKYVFPDASGNMRTLEADPQKILRHALGRAGLVEGYEHTCRRCKAKGKPYSEQHPDSEIRICPVCGMKLWPKTLPRKMRFHDLRHTTATLLLRAGVDLHRVQRILRHKDVSLTADTYGHLEVDDLRAAINKLPATPKAKDSTEP